MRMRSSFPRRATLRARLVLLYRDKFLFTGDHIAWSATRGHIYAFRSV